MAPHRASRPTACGLAPMACRKFPRPGGHRYYDATQRDVERCVLRRDSSRAQASAGLRSSGALPSVPGRRRMRGRARRFAGHVPSMMSLAPYCPQMRHRDLPAQRVSRRALDGQKNGDAIHVVQFDAVTPWQGKTPQNSAMTNIYSGKFHLANANSTEIWPQGNLTRHFSKLEDPRAEMNTRREPIDVIHECVRREAAGRSPRHRPEFRRPACP